jgi:hypothetical protein
MSQPPPGTFYFISSFYRVKSVVSGRAAMSDQSQDSSDDLSGLSGFFFYVFIVHPLTAWILKPGRFERRKSIMYAVAFLTALAAIKTGASCVSLKGLSSDSIGRIMRMKTMATAAMVG